MNTNPNRLSVEAIERKALSMRKRAVQMATAAGPRGAHIGPGMSVIDIVATLYFGVLRHDPANPRWPDRDRFILSKGHGVLGFYTALAEAGYIRDAELDTFDMDDSRLVGHPSKDLDIGVEASTGSLGHGLPIGVGIALAARIDHKTFDTYVVLGDGECNEGTVWEAALLAGQHRLGNLVAIVDHNKMQADGHSKDIVDMQPMADKWRAFRWNVVEVDGHNVSAMLAMLDERHRDRTGPLALIAHTVKGKGVSFFENDKAWHHTRSFTAEQAQRALDELNTVEPARGAATSSGSACRKTEMEGATKPCFS